MARVYFNQEQFNFGKLGRLLRSRRDGAFYRAGCKTLKNFRPTVQGAAEKRKGSRFVTEVKSSSNRTRLIPFIFGQTDSVRMEFGDQYIRFFKGTDSIFEATQTITGATQANPVVVTVAAHGYSNGDEIEINSVLGMTELNDKRYRLANVTVNTFELQNIDGNNIDGTGFTAYVSGGTAKRVYEIVSPYTTSDLVNIKYDQLGDIMYLTAGGKTIRPQKLVRLGDTNWTIANLDNRLGAVEDVNETSTTITLSGVLTESGISTWTASAGIFQAAHVDSVWAIAKNDDTSIIGYARMSSFTSSTVADFVNQTDLTPVTTTPTTNWYEATWSGVRGYPKAVAFHEDRLFWGGTDTNPLDIVGSVVGSYENYDIDDASADDALHFQMTGQVNDIQWLTSDGEFLVAGTLGGLGFVQFDVTNTTVTPRARFGSNFGSSVVQGLKLNNQVVYLHNSTKTMYEAQYNDVSLKYNSIDLNDLNPEILQSGIEEMQSVEQPDVAAYMPSQGELKGLSRDSLQKIIGWYEYNFNGNVESVATTPNTTGIDDIWFIVERTINSVTRRYIEYIDNSLEEIFLDSSITYNGVATRNFGGLDHLEGEIVSVWGDGAFAGDYTVTNGSITIPDSKSEVEKAHIGYAYNADLEVMPIDFPLPQTGGTTQALLSRINELYLILSDTLGLLAGNDVDTLTVVPFRRIGSPMDSPPEHIGLEYPEELQVPFNDDWSRASTIYLRSNNPFPCTILSIMARAEVNSN